MAEGGQNHCSPRAAAKKKPRCELGTDGCLTLGDILESFNAPINEEQAWAICFQCAKCFRHVFADQSDRRRCLLLDDVRNVRLCDDGSVHVGTVLPIPDSPALQGMANRQPATSESKLVDSLGRIIYQALDYSLSDDEERSLGKSLEGLITKMTTTEPSYDNQSNSGHETDEGIEADHGELDDSRTEGRFNLDKTIECCSNHLGNPSQAEVHYKAVCRALVAEALQLSVFLGRISNGTQELRRLADRENDACADLSNLKILDWARLWNQVIHELRTGVKLKKVEIDSHAHPIEYALTPYEILMDDIRSRRYKLNKVMINGDLPPRVKKDAHAIILDFIRSRPPLVPASRRRLQPPPPRTSCPYENLMASIRTTHHLRPTTTITVETSRTKLNEGDRTPKITKRLIKADFDSLLNVTNFEIDDGDDILQSPSLEEIPGFPHPLNVLDDNPHPSWHKTVALDLATHSQVYRPERRHSITLCQTTATPVNANSIVSNLFTSFTGQPTSLPPKISRQAPKRLFMPMQWKDPMECLSLTLEEVVHIRTVLTKAELESLIVDTPEYNDVAKGKLCFLCKKTKFAFFGPKRHKCELCKRTVCVKCCSKMRIPTEHFSNIPVYTLSPSTSSSSSSDDDTSPRSSWRLPEFPGIVGSSAGSAPSSPTASARFARSCSNQANLDSSSGHANGWSFPNSTSETDSLGSLYGNGNAAGGHQSLPVTGYAAAESGPTSLPPSTLARSPSSASSLQRRSPFLRSQTLQRSSWHSSGRRSDDTVATTVCRECRGMVRHIIVASHNSIALKLKQGSDKNAVAATFPRRLREPQQWSRQPTIVD